MADRSDSTPRDEVLTLRIHSQIAQRARRTAARRQTTLSAYLARIVENSVLHDGEIDPRQVSLREIEVSTAGKVYEVADHVLLPLFDTVKDLRLSLQYGKHIYRAIMAQAKYLAAYEEALEDFFKALERRADYEPPELLLSEDLKNAIAKFRQAHQQREKPPAIDFLVDPEWKPASKTNNKKKTRKEGRINEEE